jgi:hypothetical protein
VVLPSSPARALPTALRSARLPSPVPSLPLTTSAPLPPSTASPSSSTPTTARKMCPSLYPAWPAC